MGVAAPPVLKVDRVSKRFGGLQAVNDVTLQLGENEIVGLIGPNGAGKSTLIELISGTQRPDKGSIRFRDHELTRLPAYRVCRLGVARTFQKLRPFLGMTVLDNVMVSSLARNRNVTAARAFAVECVAFVGLSHKVDALARTLSTGQRKRLELARVMAARPAVFLLDEVMAGIDHRSIGELGDLIASIRDRGATILMVEHQMAILHRLCDRVIALDRGRKIADGPPDDVFNDPAVAEAYLGG